jgi:hypothetical protein
MTIRPADRYAAAPDLGVVTCYFNSAGFASKRANFEVFAERLARSGIACVVVECAFGDAAFELAKSPGVVRVRARDVMWQKERLLNVAVGQLPAACTKVAWLDGDVLFENADWAAETSRLLEEVPVVQPYARVVRLPRGATTDAGEGDSWPSFAAVYRAHPDRVLAGDFANHGHTGFAWAARRELLARHGLYDACISGSGDHMMAHAFAGDWSSACMDRILVRNSRHHAHFVAWCRALYKDVRARVGHVPGTLLHLWHGEMDYRRYVLRNQELARFEFDPAADIRVGESGAWEWASEKRELHRWAVEYYPSRREDG